MRKAEFIERNVYKYKSFKIDREFLVSPLRVDSSGKMRFHNLLEDLEFLKELRDFSIGFKIKGKEVEFYLIN